MANIKRGVLYAGVTSNLVNRTIEHREGRIDGFTKRYNLKRGRASSNSRCQTRDWKFRLIEETNPEWVDLWPELMGHDFIGPLSHLQGR